MKKDTNTKTDTDNEEYKVSKWSEGKNSIKEFWEEFKQVKYGIVGLCLFFLFILLMIFEPFIIPFPQASTKWRNITYWDRNPKNAAPAWVNWFTSEKLATHQFLKATDWEATDNNGTKVINGTFDYNNEFDVPPRDFIFEMNGKGDINMSIKIIRPDGEEVDLIRKSYSNSNLNQIKIPLGDTDSSLFSALQLGSKFETAENLKGLKRSSINPVKVILGKSQEGMLVDPEPLKGEYKFDVTIIVSGSDTIIEEPILVASGKVYGLMGTDSSRRDIWSGLISSIKWAMLIGLLVAFVSVIIGVIFGVSSAYFGGWVDSLMMRTQEIFVSIPILPILIVLSAVFKPNIWILILIMSCFYWTGPVRTVRSMALQIKEETYIEAAHALDASHTRIIFKHMIPQLIPYAFASMALRVPAAIVAEASISLLGLGDTSIATWGQILHGAMSYGATLQGLWWWVIPPGMFIALMGMTFAFIGFSMDKILNPKLKTR